MKRPGRFLCEVEHPEFDFNKDEIVGISLYNGFLSIRLRIDGHLVVREIETASRSGFAISMCSIPDETPDPKVPR